jgi:uncharacterized protein YjiS (DUF1127 family)
MSDITFHRPVGEPQAAARISRFIAKVARALDRILFAHRIRHDLRELPDRLRRDIGLIRELR